MNSLVLLGILGSVASIVSLLISAPTLKSRVIHAIYGFLIVVVVGSTLMYNQKKINELERSAQQVSELQSQLEQINSIKEGAKAILDNKSSISEYEVGKNRGFILTSFAFLEKNKSVFPESYAIAKTLIVDGLKIVDSAGESGIEFYDERKRMADGANTMKELLEGIAAGK